MALTMPFQRHERFPALRRVRETTTGQVQQAAEAVAQLLPNRRRAKWWARPIGRAALAVAVGGALLTALAGVLLRQRAAEARPSEGAAATRGLPSTRTEAYDAQRAAGDSGVDAVQQAATESFPASDAPVWGSGPDVPIIREGEHKDVLPYEQR